MEKKTKRNMFKDIGTHPQSKTMIEQLKQKQRKGTAPLMPITSTNGKLSHYLSVNSSTY